MYIRLLISFIFLFQGVVIRYVMPTAVGFDHGFGLGLFYGLVYALNWSVTLLAMGYAFYAGSWVIYLKVNRL